MPTTTPTTHTTHTVTIRADGTFHPRRQVIESGDIVQWPLTRIPSGRETTMEKRYAMKGSDRPHPAAAVFLAFYLCAYAFGCSGRGDEVQFRFNWPVPSHASVEMEVKEEGETLRARFSLDLVDGNTPQELRLFLRDFKFLEFGDADLDDAIVRAELAPLLAITVAMPPMIISKHGQFLRFDDWDRWVDDFPDLLRGIDPTIDQAVIDHTTSLMKNPATRQRMQATGAKDWNLWVGIWNGVRLRRGESREFVYPMNVPWGGQVDANARHIYLPKGKNETNVHQIQFRAVCSGPKLREALLKSMESLLPPRERDADRMAEANQSIGELFLAFEAEATTDPATLMPMMITSSRIIRIGRPDGGGQEQTEMRKYSFIWD